MLSSICSLISALSFSTAQYASHAAVGVKKIFLKHCVARILCQWRRSTDQFSQRPKKLREATRLVGIREGKIPNAHSEWASTTW